MFSIERFLPGMLGEEQLGELADVAAVSTRGL